MKEKKRLPEIGEMIKITERHCGEKVQPHVLVNGYYVVTGYDKTPKGVQVLVVKPMTDDTMKLRVNAERFTWVIADYYADAHKMLIDVEAKQRREHPEDFDFWARMHHYFDKKTVARIKYMPYVYAFLSMYFLETALAEAVRDGKDYRKQSNALKEVRREVERHLIKTASTADNDRVKALTYEHRKDFGEGCNNVMWWQVRNEIYRTAPGVEEDMDIKTWAVIASLFVDVLFKTEQLSADKVAQETKKNLGYTPKNYMVKALLNVCDMFSKEARCVSFKNLDMCERLIIAKVERIKFIWE